jgi:NAD+ dependent glucose-6-phosphate dehydrogenase
LSARRVLVTGATGYVASLILPALRERYALTLVDVRDENRYGHRVDDVHLLDLLDDPDDRLQTLCADVDAIVHCGFRRPTGQASYAGERVNVDMTARVFEVAAATDVQRVVCTSTNQASRWYERPYKQGLVDRVGPFDYPRPDSFYGWAKVAYESLGFLYACGSISRSVPNVQIRIVCPREIDAADFADRPLVDYLRDIAGYISARDLRQLYVRSIEAESIDDEFGVPFQIFYGVSDNARTFWSISNARRVIGYQPQDDSEIVFAADIAMMLGRT